MGGSAPTQSKEPPDLKGIKVQQSAYGLCVPIVYGTNRLGGEVIWIGKTRAVEQDQQSGGKGGASQQGNTTYEYYVALAVGLCEGPIVGIGKHWRDKSKFDGYSNWTLHLGELTQSPDSWLLSKHAEYALNYPSQAYILRGDTPLDLGTTPNLPNLSWEIQGKNIYGSGIVDALPSDIIPDFLTDSIYGAGFPTAKLGDLANFRNYCLSAGIFLSPILSEQKTAAACVDEILSVCNTRAVFSGGTLNFIPMGDQALSGNGATFTPNLTPVANITDDDLLEGVPITVNRKNQTDAYNQVKVEYLDRAHDYNAAIETASADSDIAFNGLRAQSPISAHAITTPAVAQFVGQLTLQQNLSNLNEYRFTLSPRWMLLDALDIITLTDSRIGLATTPVRLTECNEQPDGSFQCVAEDLSPGSYTVQGYGTEANSGLIPNRDCKPGNCQTPVIFESTPAATGGEKELCIATAGPQSAGEWASGQNYTAGTIRSYQEDLYLCDVTVNGSIIPPPQDAAHWEPIAWGGCNVWVSKDNATYKQIGTLKAPSRFGVLSAQLPISASIFPTADQVNTLAVDLTKCAQQILPGTHDDADLLETLCWVDGEYIAYSGAALTSANHYSLTYLQRGAFGSAAVDRHAIGSNFVRMDDRLGRFPYLLEKGKTLYIKLQSFNAYGNAAQDLSTLTPTTYTVQGITIAAPTGIVIDETKLRRDLIHVTWTLNRNVRKVRIYKRPYSVMPGTPATDPTSWKKYSVRDLATTQADASEQCLETEAHFSVGHTQGARMCYAAQLVDAFKQESAWLVASTATPSDTDDVAPAIPAIASAASSLFSDPGTYKQHCDFLVSLTFLGCDGVQVKLVDTSDSNRPYRSSEIEASGLTTATAYWEPKFKRGHAFQVYARGRKGNAWSAWTTTPANVTSGGAAAPALPSPPAVKGLHYGSNHNRYRVSLVDTDPLTNATVQELQLFVSTQPWASTAVPPDQDTTGLWKRFESKLVGNAARNGKLEWEFRVPHDQDEQCSFAARIVHNQSLTPTDYGYDNIFDVDLYITGLNGSTLVVDFSLAAVGGSGTIKYKLDFGDGTSSDWGTGATFEHTYPAQGIYSAVAYAKFTDTDGAVRVTQAAPYQFGIYPTPPQYYTETNAPQTTANVAAGSGDIAWAGTDNVKTDGSDFAAPASPLTNNQNTQGLLLTNFVFTDPPISSGWVALGISVLLKLSSSTPGSCMFRNTPDGFVGCQLVKGVGGVSTPVGAPRFFAAPWPAGETSVVLGGVRDLWDTGGLTIADLKDSHFGCICWAMNRSGANSTPKIYYCEITPYLFTRAE